MLLLFRKPRGAPNEPRTSHSQPSVEAILDSCRWHRSSLLRDRLRLRASVRRFKRLSRRMVRTRQRLGVSLRRLRRIDRRAIQGGPSV